MGQPNPAVEEWRLIARGPDLLYNVLSWPDKRNTWTERDFYETGKEDWEDFRRHWEHYEPNRGEHCVEIGCGVGRISSQLGADFSRVTALDVSPDMIARAKAVSPSNVEFVQVNGAEIPLAPGTADAVFSVHVMQHLESLDLLLAYVREIARVLRPGGTAMIHIQLTGWPPPNLLRRLRAEWTLRKSRRSLHSGRGHSTMRTRTYWLNDVWRGFTEAGFVDVELRMIPVRSNGYGHQFWLVRRP